MTEYKGELDLGLIEKQDYKMSNLKEVIKESAPELKEKPNSPETVQPMLDKQQQDISEPEIIEEIKVSKFDPWWRRLGLSSNPFPDTDGLGTIPESMHESIVVMTEVFEKYIHYIDKVPSELFKNTIFYGEFGSGKTTLFEYLQTPLVKSNIHSAIIRLSAEPDYQSFLMKFKQKLSRELINIYSKLTGMSIVASIEPLSLDDAITKGIKSIESTGRCKGFVIFVDDIYKPQFYEKVAQMFLNNLQTFTAELKKQMVLPNIGFFISLPLEWESILKDNQVYSGSVTWEEHMPLPTVEEASKMFNERLAAFAIAKEKCGPLEPEVAQQVYRTLFSRKAFTFRNFIKECLRRFESGDFGILIANPVSMNHATLKNILELLRGNSTISDGIDEILTSSMSVQLYGIELLELI